MKKIINKVIVKLLKKIMMKKKVKKVLKKKLLIMFQKVKNIVIQAADFK